MILAIPVVVIVAILYYVGSRPPNEERIEALESQVEELREELEAEKGEPDDRQ